MKRLLNSHLMGQLFRYGLVTASSYVLLFLGTFLLVEEVGLSPSLAYFILITLIYFGVYLSYTKFVFRSEFTRRRLIRFIFISISIWIVNNLFYNFLILVLLVPYLWAVFLNLIIFGGIRFFIQRLFVFGVPKEHSKAILTFDVELWHESGWIKKLLPKNKEVEDFLIESIKPILETLKGGAHKATFFVTGTVLEKYPQLMREVAQAGHEIGSHSFNHQRLTELQEDEFSKQMAKQIELIEKISGKKPMGFRAPHFSLNAKSSWLIQSLATLGFKYDSSVFPMKTPEYGLARAPQQPYQISFRNPEEIDAQSPLTELPLPVFSLGPIKIPCSGGIYFRLLPLWIFSSLLRLAAKQSKSTPILYFHPHELCALTPKVKGPWLKSKLKYWGTKNSLRKFKLLAKDFQFDSIENGYIR